MSSSLQFLQRHCLILKLMVLHRPKSAFNEMLWSHQITSELSKICKVLYARPTFSKVHNTFVRQNPGLDLVVSCYDVGLLSPILFSIRGFEISGRQAVREPALELVCPPVQDYFSLEPTNPRLDSLRSQLTRQWSRMKHVSGSDRNGDPAVVRIEPWIFNTQPVRKVVTSENNLVELNHSNLRSQYNVRDHKGSRFFQEEKRVEEKRQSLVSRDNGQASDAYLQLKPVLYESLDSMPESLKKWLSDVGTDDLEPDAANQDRLDLLLHGFKGFD